MVASCIITWEDMLLTGLELLSNGTLRKKNQSQQVIDFKRLYGSSPRVLARIWYDLQTTEVEDARISVKREHLCHYLMAHYWLQTGATAVQLEYVFMVSEPSVRKWVWYYVAKIAHLKSVKIIWPAEWDTNDPNVEIFTHTVDGVHFSIDEPSHPRYNKDKKYKSYKEGKGAALSYEIAIHIWKPQVVHTLGPFPASQHDTNIWNRSLRQKIKHSRRGIGDQGYRGLFLWISTHNSHDNPKVREIKRRARARHESFNGKIKTFSILKNTFRYPIEKHQQVFDAVIVIAQYQMEIDSPIFDV